MNDYSLYIRDTDLVDVAFVYPHGKYTAGQITTLRVWDTVNFLIDHPFVGL